MIWLAVISVLLVIFVLVLFQDWQSKNPVSPEAAMHAAVELHRIRRQLDVTELKSEQRGDTSRLRREIQDALDGPRAES